MVVGEDFAALSTGGFSRRDLLDRAIVIDRVASDGTPFGARRDAAEMFWSAGNPCNREVVHILGEILKPLSMPKAIAAAVRTTMSYGPLPGGRQSATRCSLTWSVRRWLGFTRMDLPSFPFRQVQVSRTSRMKFRADLRQRSRMIGGGGMPKGIWAAHVETSTGGSWSEERISDVLAEYAPLALDGSVIPIDKESPAQAAHRRMKCRHVPRGGAHGASDYDGFPAIRYERVECPATKGQVTAWGKLREEISEAIHGALDKPSQKHLERLLSISEQSPEAALFIWKQGGMSGMSAPPRRVVRRPGRLIRISCRCSWGQRLKIVMRQI